MQNRRKIVRKTHTYHSSFWSGSSLFTFWSSWTHQSRHSLATRPSILTLQYTIAVHMHRALTVKHLNQGDWIIHSASIFVTTLHGCSSPLVLGLQATLSYQMLLSDPTVRKLVMPYGCACCECLVTVLQ